ncbi:MAG: hypothetical protein JJU06_11260 [Ectothiorhodospiraceae bacterium]|nr:hypothetical protein [Ectothiorhodospiraceae bacterium]
MLKWLGCALIVMLALSACSDNPEVLRFKPQHDEQRRYQLLTHVEVSASSSFGSSSESMDSTMLVDYRVSEEGDLYRIGIMPQYMMVIYPGGRFSNLDPPTPYGEDVLGELMSGGMTLSLDKGTGEPVDFVLNSPGAQWEELGLAPLRDGLGDQLPRPGFGAGIPLEEGATLELEAQTPMPALTVTVIRLGAERLTLRLSGDDEESKLFGYMTVERETGWPVQAIMVMEAPFDERGFSGTMRSVVSIMPADWAFGLGLDYMESITPWDFGSFGLPDDSEQATEETVFASDIGTLDFESDRLRLMYQHEVETAEALGRMAFSELQAIDSEGNPIELQFQALEPFSYQGFNDSRVSTSADVMVLGWNHVEEDFEDFAGIEATVSWLDQERVTLSLPVGEERVEREHAGARVVMTPGEEEASYVLALYSTRDAYFDFHMEGPDHGVLDYSIDPDAPGWIKEGEGRLLNSRKHDYFSLKLTVYFEEEPEEIDLSLVLLKRESRAQRRITFYHPDAMLDNVNFAPSETLQLYREEESFSGAAYGDDRAFATAGLMELEPETFGRPQLYLTLTPEQSVLCELVSPVGNDLAGRKLGWKRYQPYRGWTSQLRLSPREIYQFASDNGEQSYFYQHEVTIGLHCDGRPEWRALDIDLGERDWLVELTELLGDDWEEHELASRPLAEFLKRYRFLDDRERPLGVMLPSSSARALQVSENTLREFATGDGKLRIGGHVQRVERLHATGEPLTREWTHRFPDLPGYDGDLNRPMEDLQ